MPVAEVFAKRCEIRPMSPSFRRCAFLFLAACLCAASGCYTRGVEGDRAMYGFSGWLLAAVTLGALAAAPAGWLLRRQWKKGGFVLIGMAPVLLLVVVPGLFRDRIEVTPEGFSQETGLWFAPTTLRQTFQQRDTLEIRVSTQDGRGGPRRNYDLYFYSKGMPAGRAPVGDLMRFALREIVENAKNRGLRVVGEELLPEIEGTETDG
jgi:hypothetical protein